MSRKIFIIEDDANILYGLQAKFSVDGFQVKTDTGSEIIEEILKKMKDFNPNYIILDLILPKTDGFSILSGIKADKDMAEALVFVFTNLSDEDSKTRSKNLGADYYFIKNDFAIDEFVEKVEKIIGNKLKIKN